MPNELAYLSVVGEEVVENITQALVVRPKVLKDFYKFLIFYELQLLLLLLQAN